MQNLGLCNVRVIAYSYDVDGTSDWDGWALRPSIVEGEYIITKGPDEISLLVSARDLSYKLFRV